MASETPPVAYSPKAKGDDEVLSQRTFPGQGEVQEAVMVAQEARPWLPDTWGSRSPWRLGASISSAPGRIRFRRPMRLQNPVNNLLRKKGVCLFHQ